MKIVLLDLDNTLIDSDYNLTVSDDELRPVVRKLREKDIHIGLCSDSAAVTLKQWVDRLGLTGPIIAERGAVILSPEKQAEEVLEPSKTSWFRELRELFVSRIARDFPEATIVVGDATRFVKNKVVNSVLTPQVFAINGFREASFSFFARRLNHDQSLLEPDSELLIQSSRVVTELVSSLGKDIGNLFWDENPTHGILIVHAITTEKWRGVSTLINRIKPEQTVMVGDSMSDFLGLPNVLQYAVGNANPCYKEKSAFVSKDHLTKGVIECLQHI
jgi:hydroxymethylpyrimidine pyrophosphatase-like HAD family hydrolase